MTTTTARVQKLVEYGVPEDRARVAVAQSQRDKLMARDIVVGGAYTLADDMPDTAHVVHPIFVQAQLTALTAHPGHGKSTFCLGAAFAFVLKRSLGLLDPRGDGLVYFVSAEDVAGTRLRLYAEAIRHDLDAADRSSVDERLRWVHVNAALRPELIIESIREDAESRPVALVFVDTGPATFVGDEENSNTDQQAHAAAWRRGTELPGSPCVVVLGHPPKGASADALVPRGGSAFTGSLDANLTLWKEDDVMTVSHTKLRSEHFEPLAFRLDPIPLQLNSGARITVPVAAAIGDGGERDIDRKISNRREALLCAMHSSAEPLTVRELAERSSCKRSMAGSDLADMAGGRVPLMRKSTVTGRYELTPEGRKVAAAIVASSAKGYREARNG